MADIPGNRTTTAVFSPGGGGGGVFEYPGDSDWYRVNLKQGVNYYFNAQAYYNDKENNSNFVNFELYDQSGKLLDGGSDDNESAGGFSYRATYTGVHYYAINGYDYHGGGYWFGSGTDVGDDFVNVPKLSVGSKYENTCNYTGDVDLLQINLQAGKVYDLMLIGSSTNFMAAGLTVLDSSRILLKEAWEGHASLDDSLPSWMDTGDWDEAIGVGDFRAPYTGTYYLTTEVYDYGGQYRVLVSEDRSGNAVWKPTSPTTADDTLSYSNAAETVNSLAGDDFVYGGGGNDTINGGDGADIVIGGAGADYLNGGPGVDRIYGGADADRVTGGFGIGDQLFGGAGPDRFEFGASYGGGTTPYDEHAIQDFLRGSDKIVLSAIDANEAKAGDQAFKFGNGAVGTLVVVGHANGTSSIYGHTDGDLVPDFTIRVNGNAPLVAADFAL